MVKVYSVFVHKPKNPLKWLFNDSRVEKIADKVSGLVGFIKHCNGIEVLYENENVKLSAPLMFKVNGYKADNSQECFIKTDLYCWFIKYRGKCSRWIYGRDYM